MSPSPSTFRRRAWLVSAAAGVLFVPAARAAAQGAEPVDTAAVARIVREAKERSQVMELASWMTDVLGARLTGTEEMRKAGEWAKGKLTEWGLQNAALEPFALPEFNRAWSNDRFVVRVTAPTTWTVLGYASAWTASVEGPVTAEAVYAPIADTTELARWKGKLKGKVVLTAVPRALQPHFEGDASRLTDAQLERMAQWQPPAPGARADTGEYARRIAEYRRRAAVNAAVARFLAEEGALATVLEGAGDDGTVFSNNGGEKNAAKPVSMPQLVFAAEHYGRIVRTLQKNVPVTLELDVRNRLYDAAPNLFNVVAEIPGTDKRLKGEVVMLGAHYDSWHTATGATDNAAGSAVMMEAVRILKTLNLPMKRTVRIALWTGEEQGLFGSRQYVKAHYGDTVTHTPEHARFAGYFNVDNGTGKIRGVYAQGNQGVVPVFQAWLAPFAADGSKTVTLMNTGGTDHLAYDAVGLPGFQFIQDGIDYGTRTHHSNMDTWERLQADDMRHNAAVVAAFVYLTANRAEKLPRKAGARVAAGN